MTKFRQLPVAIHHRLLSATIREMNSFVSFALTGIAVFATSFVCGHQGKRTNCHDPSHITLLDGLRAVLACSVMTFHYLSVLVLIRTGTFAPLDIEQPWKLLGAWSVPMFFCITAFLFTKKAMSLSSNFIVWSKLYIGRVFRLMPMATIAAALLCLVLADFNNGIHFRVPFSTVLSIATASLTKIPPTPENFPMEWRWRMAATPHWSLHYEWLFYLSLPAMSLLIKKKTNWIYLVSSALVLVFLVDNLAHDLSKSFHITPFLSGIASALLERRAKEWSVLRNPLVPLVTFALIITSAYTGKQELIFMLSNTILMLCVIGNNPGLHWLRDPRLITLGEASFGIYIFHGIIQVGAIAMFGGYSTLSQWPFLAILLWIVLQVAIVCLTSRLANKYVERRWIDIGYRIISKLDKH